MKLLNDSTLLADEAFRLLSVEVRDELPGQLENQYFHEIIHGSEIPVAINLARFRVMNLWFELGWSHRHESWSVFTSVPLHTDPWVNPDEAFVVIIMEVRWDVNLFSNDVSIPLRSWQIIYFDPHVEHGTNATQWSFASIIRIPVKKKTPN